MDDVLEDDANVQKASDHLFNPLENKVVFHCSFDIQANKAKKKYQSLRERKREARKSAKTVRSAF